MRQEFEKRNTKVKFDYAVLKKDDIQKSIQPSDAELKAFYDKNKANYTNSIPEKRKVSYVVVDTSQVQATTPVTAQELQSYYDQHRDEYRVPEQVNVRHILIKTPLPGPDGKVDQKGAEARQAKAEDIAKQLKAGAKFEDLAKKYLRRRRQQEQRRFARLDPARTLSVARHGQSRILLAQGRHQRCDQRRLRLRHSPHGRQTDPRT